jgi:hypothetical protein
MISDCRIWRELPIVDADHRIIHSGVSNMGVIAENAGSCRNTSHFGCFYNAGSDQSLKAGNIFCNAASKSSMSEEIADG